MNTLERFWGKVDLFFGITDEDCWNWTGLSDANGYGRFRFARETHKASRIIWALLKGPPGKFYVLHKCDNPQCVNPSHLYLGTQRDNMRDVKLRKRHYNSRKIRCWRGHDFTPDNIRLNNGSRVCRQCARINSTNQRARIRARTSI